MSYRIGGEQKRKGLYYKIEFGKGEADLGEELALDSGMGSVTAAGMLGSGKSVGR